VHPPRHFQPLEGRVAALFASSARPYDRHPHAQRTVPRARYDRGHARATRMARDGVPAVLLHGDLTPSNILDGGPERRLVAIDFAPERAPIPTGWSNGAPRSRR
jgi:streptomycin 6-kinase